MRQQKSETDDGWSAGAWSISAGFLIWTVSVGLAVSRAVRNNFQERVFIKCDSEQTNVICKHAFILAWTKMNRQSKQYVGVKAGISLKWHLSCGGSQTCVDVDNSLPLNTSLTHRNCLSVRTPARP